MPITVCGLGPGSEAAVTPATLAAARSADRCFLRTSRHPSAHLIDGAETFDRHYETAETFEEVYQSITGDLIEAVSGGETVTYVVPGSPLILERSVRYLRSNNRLDVTLIPAISFLDEAWNSLGIDPIEEGVRLIDGHRFATQAAGQSGPLLVAHTHSNWILSDIKLSLDAGPEQKAVILQGLGTPDERVIEVEWPELDRTIEADHLTSVYLPKVRGTIGFTHQAAPPEHGEGPRWRRWSGLG